MSTACCLLCSSPRIPTLSTRGNEREEVVSQPAKPAHLQTGPPDRRGRTELKKKSPPVESHGVLVASDLSAGLRFHPRQLEDDWCPYRVPAGDDDVWGQRMKRVACH